MISQLINEPYFSSIDPIFVTNEFIGEKKLSDYWLARIIVNGLVRINFSNHNKLLKTSEDYEKVIKETSIETIESAILELIFEIDYEIEKTSNQLTIDFIDWKKTTFSEKLKYLEIIEYAADRDINDLILYFRDLEIISSELGMKLDYE